MKLNVNYNRWIGIFIQKILAHVDYLNGLDTAIGDGDHGDNMKKGVLELNSYIEMHSQSTGNNFENPEDLFRVMSVIFLSNVHGASGPLYAAAFKNMSDAWIKEKSLDEIISSGMNGMKKIGHCELGDKTMLDVWLGIYELVKDGNLEIREIQQLVENTKEQMAKKGRASYFGDRSIGHIDPGAQSSGYFFEAMLESVSEENTV